MNTQNNHEDFRIDQKIKDYIPSFYKKAIPFDRISNISDLKEVFDISNSNIYEGIVQKQKTVYERAFGIFGDLSTVYCYLKLRDIQINKIIYEIGKVLNKEEHEIEDE